MILVFEHRHGLVDIPVTKLSTLTNNGQLFTDANLWSTYLQTYRTLEFCRSTHLALVDHNAVRQCRAVHISILRNVNPVVVNGVTGCFLCSKLQTMGLYEPLMASLFITMHQTVVVVNKRTGLGILGYFHKPVSAINRRHLML